MSDCEYWGGVHRKEDGRAVYHGRPAIRILWKQERGPLPGTTLLHHTCENKWCMNLDHVEPLTRGEHITEHGLARRDWGQALKTHCPAGHLYDEANTYHFHRKDGRHERHCRTCAREGKRRRRASK